MWADRVGRYFFKDLIQRELEAARRRPRRRPVPRVQHRRYSRHPVRLSPGEHPEVRPTAYRQNPMAFRIIELTTSYVLGGGATLEAEDEAVQKWLDEWWNHPKNRMPLRQFELLNELLISGELFMSQSTSTRPTA